METMLKRVETTSKREHRAYNCAAIGSGKRAWIEAEYFNCFVKRMKRRFYRPAVSIILVLAVLLVFLPVGKAFASGGWTDPAPVVNTFSISEFPSLVVDGTGKVHIVWSETQNVNPTTSNYWIDYASSVNGSSPVKGFSWNVSGVASPSTTILFTPFVSLGLNSRLHLVWAEKVTENNYDIFYSTSTGGGWTGKANLSNTSDLSTTPVIIADSQGRLRLVWTDKTSGLQQIYFRSGNADGTAWSPYQNISTMAPAPDYDVLAPALAVDSNDNVHGVWHSADTSQPIYYSKWMVSGGSLSWDPPVPISGAITGSQYPKIASRGTNLYVVWSKEVSNVPGISSTDDVYFTKWTQSGGWTTPAAISLSRVDVRAVPPYNLVASNPDIAVDSHGTIHVVWHGKAAGDVTEKIYYSRSSDGGSTWTTPRAISGSGGPSVKPAIKVDSGGTAYVVWQDYRTSSSSEIYFVSSIQQVFLPVIRKSYAGGW